jgi:hypothetical protein
MLPQRFDERLARMTQKSLIITLVAVAVLAVAGIAVATGGGEEKQKTKGTDLTAIKCPLAATGQTSGGVEELKPAKNAFDTAELIGLSLADARAKAARHTCAIVVSVQDGKGLPVPLDVDPKRIYVYTEKGAVTQIEGVGGGL